MKNDKWIVDAIALFGLILVFMTDLTGFALHEWIGISIAALLMIHFLQHWGWVINTSQRLGKLKGKVLSRYLVDGGLMIGFSVITITGLVISSILSLPLDNYETWRVIHVLSSYATLFFLAVKLVLHWDMIAKVTDKVFAVDKQSMTLDQQKRRKFLRGFGITALAGLFVAAEVKEWQNKTGTYFQATDASAEQGVNSIDVSVADTITVEPQEGLSEVVDPTIVPTESVFTEDENVEPTIEVTLVPTSEPTIVPTATAETVLVTTTGVVKCHRGCSYPGRCGRYYDDNQNGKCDLGEPIW